jgi:hypothetical protein
MVTVGRDLAALDCELTLKIMWPELADLCCGGKGGVQGLENVVSGTTDCDATRNWWGGDEPGPTTQIRSDKVVTESHL